VGIVCLVSAAQAQEAAAPRLERLVPQDTLMLFTAPNVRRTIEQFKRTGAYALWQDPETQRYLAPHMPLLLGKWHQAEAAVSAATGKSLDELLQAYGGAVSYAVLDATAGKMPDAIGMLVPRDPSALPHLVQKMDEVAAQHMKKVDMHGFKVTCNEQLNSTQYWTIARGALLFSFGESAMQQVLVRLTGGAPDPAAAEAVRKARETSGPFAAMMLEKALAKKAAAGSGQPSLAENENFKKVTDRAGAPDAAGVVYVNVERAIEKALETAPPMAATVVQALGLRSVKAAGVSVTIRGKGMEDVIYIHAPGARTGIVSLLAPKPFDPDLLKLVPRDAVSFRVMRCDLAALWREINRIVAEVAPAKQATLKQQTAMFEQMFGMSLEQGILAGLGTEMVSYISGGGGGGPPGMPSMGLMGGGFALIFTVSDRQKVEQFMSAAINMVAQQAAQRAGAFRGFGMPGAQPAAPPPAAPPKPQVYRADHKGATILAASLPLPMPIPLQLACGISDKYLVISLSPMAVTNALDRAESGAASILGNERFVQARTHALAHAGMISYSDVLRRLPQVVAMAPMMAGILQQQAPALRNLDIQSILDPTQFPSQATFDKYVLPWIGSFAAGPEGMTYKGHSSIGSLGGGPGVVAMIGAGAALPALGRARQEGQRAVCRSNLGQIGKALFSYAADHNDLNPATLQDLFPMHLHEKKILLCPSGGRPRDIGGMLCSYRYVGTVPFRDATPGTAIAYDLRGNHPRGRNVLFFDGHVAWLRELQLKAQLAQDLKRFEEVFRKNPNAPGDLERIRAFYRDQDPPK